MKDQPNGTPVEGFDQYGVNIAALTAPFNPTDHKKRKGAFNKEFTYVPGHRYIERLNKYAGAWNLRIVTQEWRKDIFTVTVELEIPGHGSRQGTGVQLVTEKSGEDLVKGAETDALKNAAKYFGMGLYLYNDDESDIPDYGPGGRPVSALNAANQRPLPPRPTPPVRPR